MTKTYKRETSWAMLTAVFSLFGYGMYDPDSTAFATAEALKLPVFAFAAGAFGLDAVAKQLMGTKA